MSDAHQNWINRTVSGLCLQPGANVALVDFDGTMLSSYGFLGRPDNILKAAANAFYHYRDAPGGYYIGRLLHAFGHERTEAIYQHRAFHEALDVLFTHVLKDGRLVILTASPEPFVEGVIQGLAGLWAAQHPEVLHGAKPEAVAVEILQKCHVIGTVYEEGMLHVVRGETKALIADGIKACEGVNVVLGAGNHLPADQHITRAALQLLVKDATQWADAAFLESFWKQHDTAPGLA
ncbi:hypothetical protein GC177_07835 [bacterium]|nr:hypothetical protein [bacterium]